MKVGGTLDKILTDAAFQGCTEMVEAAVGCPGRVEIFLPSPICSCNGMDWVLG